MVILWFHKATFFWIFWPTPFLCSLFIFTFHTRPGPQVQMFQLSQTLKNTRLGDSRTGTWKRRQFRQFRQSAGAHHPRQFRRVLNQLLVYGCRWFVKKSTKIILYIYIKLCVYIYILSKNHTSFFFLLKFPWVVPRHIQTRSWKPQKTWNQAGLSWFIMVYPSGAINVSPDPPAFLRTFPRASRQADERLRLALRSVLPLRSPDAVVSIRYHLYRQTKKTTCNI